MAVMTTFLKQKKKIIILWHVNLVLSIVKLQCRHVNYCVLCLMSVGGLQETRSDHQERTPISCPMFNTSAVWIFFFFFTPHYFTRPVVATRPPEKKKRKRLTVHFLFFLSLFYLCGLYKITTIWSFTVITLSSWTVSPLEEKFYWHKLGRRAGRETRRGQNKIT